MKDDEKIDVLKNHVLRLVQDLANYRLFVGEYAQRPMSQDEAIMNFNMTRVHCDQALEALRTMGLWSCPRA